MRNEKPLNISVGGGRIHVGRSPGPKDPRVQKEVINFISGYGPYLKLELGPGQDAHPWPSIGLNPNADPEADIICDLEWGIPLPDESVDEIYSNQTLEHLDRGVFIDHMNEEWRVLKPGGFADHCVPHYLSPWAWGDPTHKNVFTEASFLYFCQDPKTKEPFVASFSDYGIKANFVLEKREVRVRVDVHVVLRKPRLERLYE